MPTPPLTPERRAWYRSYANNCLRARKELSAYPEEVLALLDAVDEAARLRARVAELERHLQAYKDDVANRDGWKEDLRAYHNY